MPALPRKTDPKRRDTTPPRLHQDSLNQRLDDFLRSRGIKFGSWPDRLPTASSNGAPS